MNAYDERMARRKARLLERAQEARDQSAALYQQEREMGQYVPLGQPILVGHHSEGRHRRHLERMNSLTRKGIAADRLAELLEEKAATVGKGGIAFDDPDAVAKLEAQLASREADQVAMKEFNKRARKLVSEDERKALASSILTENQQELLRCSHYRYDGFPKYMLTNNSSTIRRIRSRIEELRNATLMEDIELARPDFGYKEDSDEERVIFSFNGKPDEQVRHLLRSKGWKWAPSRGEWVRLLTANARRDGRAICAKVSGQAVKDQGQGMPKVQEETLGAMENYICKDCGKFGSYCPIVKTAGSNPQVLIYDPCCERCNSSNVHLRVSINIKVR